MLKFVPLAVIGIVGLFYIKGGNFTPFTPAHGGFDWHINAAATLALWAFIGLESATVPAEEVKDPERTIPRATILGTLGTTMLYIVALVAIVGVLSQAVLAGSSAPFADAANAIWGGTFLGLAWGKWIALVAMAATLGALNGWILLTARVSLAAADDGLFPKSFARVHGKRRTPVFGLVVSSVLVSALVLYNWNASFGQRFTDIVLLATWMTLIAYAYAAAAEVVLFFRERSCSRGHARCATPRSPSLAFAYSVWAIWGSGQEWLAKGFMLLLFGIPVFVFMKWRQGRTPLEPLHVPDEWHTPSATRAHRRQRHVERRRSMRKVIIMGAGGRDFHDFNVVFRNDPRHRGRRVHGGADSRHRRPRLPGLACGAAVSARDPDQARVGAHRPDPASITSTRSSSPTPTSLTRTVMHKASTVLAAGATSGCSARTDTMLRSTQARRRRDRRAHGLRQEPDQPARRADPARRRLQGRARPASDAVRRSRGDAGPALRHARGHRRARIPTIEEREEYEAPVRHGHGDVRRRRLRGDPPSGRGGGGRVIWDGGNNDFPFYAPDLFITVADPLRPGHELPLPPGRDQPPDGGCRRDEQGRHRRGITDGRRSDRQHRSRQSAGTNRPGCIAGRARATDPRSLGARVLVVDDGPTLTHGGMPFGAGTVAARQGGALRARRSATVRGRLDHGGPRKVPEVDYVLPAMGYSPEQLHELEETINAATATS